MQPERVAQIRNEKKEDLSDVQQHPLKGKRPKSIYQRVKIITTLSSTVLTILPKEKRTAIFADRARAKLYFHSWALRIKSSSKMDSVARLRDSEEDVYYRIDSMLWKELE